MPEIKTFAVTLTRATDFTIEAQDADEALQIAKAQSVDSVYDSEVTEITEN